jgi:hypothetical protein
VEQPPRTQEKPTARNPDMTAIKELDTILLLLIQAEEKTDELATVIGNVDHIHDEYEPQDKHEELYISALVKAEILAEEVLEILYAKFVTSVNYSDAIFAVRSYVQNTDVNELSIEALEAEIAKVL